jgi:putative hydrolase of the HAD superfamily
MALVDQYAGVIFDYGGVLAFHQTAGDAQKMAGIAGLAPEVFEPLYWAGRGSYDKGLTTAEDYWNDIAERGNTKFSASQIMQLIEADIVSWTNFDSQIYDFIGSLVAGGKRVAVLSNMPHELGQALKTRTEAFAPFHHITLSYEVRSIKPEPDIYHDCLKGLGLAPQQTLFLDDRIENVRGAMDLGINAVQFTSRDEVLPKLTA